MKKLLSLLSVLTISGTAVPTTIAASPYQKEETIQNNDINYQQINNLETLSRDKRESYTKTVLSKIGDGTGLFAAGHVVISVAVPNPVTPFVAAGFGFISVVSKTIAGNID